MASLSAPVRRMRWWLALGAVLIAVTVSLVVVADRGSGAQGDQCPLPVSERTGGWMCPRR